MAQHGVDEMEWWPGYLVRHLEAGVAGVVPKNYFFRRVRYVDADGWDPGCDRWGWVLRGHQWIRREESPIGLRQWG